MIRNFIITTLRHFYRYKGYTLTNIFGLAIGLATCLLIFLYVQDEMSYDRFFSEADNIYRLEPHWVGQGEDSHWAATQGSVLPEIEKSYPEVMSSVKIHKPYHPPIFTRGDKRFCEKYTLYADTSFFRVFDYNIIQGDPATMLEGPGKIVLTQSTANRYFGSEDPVGQFLRIDTTSYMVSGIVEDTPPNSHLKFDILVSLDQIRKYWDGVDREGPATFYSYVKFADEQSASQVIRKYNDNIYTHLGMVVAGDSTNIPEDWEVSMIFNPITKIHLNSHAEKEISENSDRKYVMIFSTVAFFILIIACFNYMNLATAKSARRSREVGLRKVLGATRQHIFSQFIGESFTLTIVSMIIALLITELALPEFNSFTDKSLALNITGNPPLLILIFTIVIIVGILSGTYPSLFMARFSPIKSLKGNPMTSGGSGASLYLRRGLVFAQFAISIFLIVGILTVNKQLQFIRNKKLGFDKEQVVVIQMPDRAATAKMDIMKNELLQNPDIIKVAATSNIPGERIPFLTVRIPGNDQENNDHADSEGDDSFTMRTWSGGYDFVETLGIELSEGRSFSKAFGTDEHQGFIINEAAVKQLGLENPIGHNFEYLYGLPEPKRGKIIGVIKDFHYASLHHEIEPLLIHIEPNYMRYLIAKISTRNPRKIMSDIESVWADHIPYLPMNARFLETSYDNLYRKEMSTGTILTIFTILAIVIAVLGLFGLASFVTSQRTREIGIRKVLGASVSSIIGNLSREFIILIALANLAAWIPAYLFLQDWLSSFSFRTSINIWIFVASAFISLIIAISTVGTKAWLAVRANPVDTLRMD